MEERVLGESELFLNEDGSVYHLNLQPEQIAGTIITVGDPDRVPLVSKHFDSIDTRVQNREFVTHTGECNGQRLSVVSTGIGTDNIDIVLNELDALVNIDLTRRVPKKELASLTIVRVGTTGALQADIALDSFIVSKYAIGLDGLLGFYQYHENEIEADLLSEFCSHMEGKGNRLVPYVASADKELVETFSKYCEAGITVTCPGFYAPQGRSLRLAGSRDDFVGELQRFSSRQGRITNFEMETAGVLGLGGMLGHRCCSLNVVVANRISKQISNQAEMSMETLLEMMLNVLV